MNKELTVSDIKRLIGWLKSQGAYEIKIGTVEVKFFQQNNLQIPVDDSDEVVSERAKELKTEIKKLSEKYKMEKTKQEEEELLFHSS